MALTPKHKNSGLSTTESPLCQNGIIPLNLIVEFLLKNTSKNAQIWKFPLPNPLLPLASYYPFGMVIEGRSASSGDQYRYGFNGQEEEKEVITNENLVYFEFRIYDSRHCSFVSIDPMTRSYPFQSPYLFASNNPIVLIDFKGLGSENSNDFSTTDDLDKGNQVPININTSLNYSWDFNSSDGNEVKRTWLFFIGGALTTPSQRNERDGQNHETSIWSLNNEKDMYNTRINGFGTLTESDHFIQVMTPFKTGKYEIGATMFKEKTKKDSDNFGYEAPSPTFWTLGRKWATENGKFDVKLNIQGGPGFLLGVPRYDGIFQCNPLGKLYRPVGFVGVLMIKVDFIIVEKFIFWGAITTTGVYTWPDANTVNGPRPSTDYATMSVKWGVGLPIRIKD